jgi:hypothetical protein
MERKGDGMAELTADIHVALERNIVPKIQVGIKIAVIGAVLLIFFTPNTGLVGKLVQPRICWLISLVALAMLGCAAFVVIYVPAFYRRLSKMLKSETPRLMRVTLRNPDDRNGNLLAELRPHESAEDEPAEVVVPVLNKIDVPSHFPAHIYGNEKKGPVVIETAHGILWPAPDEKQVKLEELFRVRG